MQRPADGRLLPLELDALHVADDLARSSTGTSIQGGGWFHTYSLVKALAEKRGTKLYAHGTLYKLVHRLADANLLAQRIETEEEAAAHSGPIRRYFRITAAGRAALAEEDELTPTSKAVVKGAGPVARASRANAKRNPVPVGSRRTRRRSGE